MQGDPTGDDARDAHPPYGEVRTFECSAGHVAAKWWRPGSLAAFEAVGDNDPDAAEGAPCPVCGLPLTELRALIDGRVDADEVS